MLTVNLNSGSIVGTGFLEPRKKALSRLAPDLSGGRNFDHGQRNFPGSPKKIVWCQSNFTWK